MFAEISFLKNDLEKKFAYLTELKQLKEASRLKIWNYFEAIINEIDVAAEEYLESACYSESAWIQEINSKRMDMINELKKQQKFLIDALPKILEDSTTFINITKKCCQISYKIQNQFRSDGSCETKKEENVNRYLDQYETLVLEITELTNKLEGVLLDDKTFFFMKSNPHSNTSNFGILVIMDEFLTTDEINCLK